MVISLLSTMFLTGAASVEQSHPITQLTVPDSSPDNHFDMEEGIVSFSGGGFVGEHSQGNLMLADPTTQRPVWVGSPQTDQQDLKVFGDIKLGGEIVNTDSGGDVANDWNVHDAVTAQRMSTESFESGPSSGGAIQIGYDEPNKINIYSWGSEQGVGKIGVSDTSGFGADGTLKIGADLEVLGSKNFIHKANSTHEVVYTSQESASARAVLEGTVTVKKGSKTVKLPGHFEEVVSDKEPDIRIQLTPRELTTVAATERSQEQFTVKTGEQSPVEIDYRITGVREGFEVPEVVRRR